MIFIAALRAGVMDVHHSAIFLSHFGHLGPAYDSCLRELPYVLQDEGIYNSNADTVQQVVGTALQDVSGRREGDISHIFNRRLPYSLLSLISSLMPTTANPGKPFSSQSDFSLFSSSPVRISASDASWHRTLFVIFIPATSTGCLGQWPIS